MTMKWFDSANNTISYLRAHLTLTPPCISNHMPSKMYYEINYPSTNFNSATVKFGNGEIISPPSYNGRDYLFVMRLKQIHVRKRGLRFL